MKVYKECCKNCLLSPDRIVSPTRAKEIITNCAKTQSHFICHKATMEGDDIVCRTFFDKFGHYSQMIRISERFGGIEFIEQPESKKLPTYSEMRPKKIK